MIDTASPDEFFKFLLKRHDQWYKRHMGVGWPWSNDTTLNEHQFDTVFHRLDPSYQKLEQLLKSYIGMQYIKQTKEWILFNICAFRIAGHEVFVRRFDEVNSKHSSLFPLFENREKLCEEIGDTTLEHGFKTLTPYYRKKWIIYQIVCDFRFTSILQTANDRLKWVYLDKEVREGMLRIGFEPTLETVRALWETAKAELKKELFSMSKVPFELCEIARGLRAFNKYERLKHGN